MRRRRGSERGASAVEFALIANVLALLFVGIVDFGSIYSDHVAVRQGAREGARQLVKAKGDTGYTSGTCASTLTTGDFAGGAQSTRTRSLFCMVKDRVDLEDVAGTRVAIRFPGGTVPTTAGGSVAVCAAYPAESLTGFFGALLDDKVVRTRTVMRVEKLFTTSPFGSGAGAGSLEEAYPFRTNATTTADWSWCVPDIT